MGWLSLIFLVQKQRLEELRLFKELFAGFNARYDRMNGQLMRIATEPDDAPLASLAAGSCR